MEKAINTNNIGNYCKNFRINVLKMGLVEFSEKNKESYKNIWAFENGKSTNFKYIFYYYKMCDEKLNPIFARGLFKAL